MLAIGDGRNDIEMLRWAGRGVAMGQAVEEVQAAADAVTETVYDDGVVVELSKWWPVTRGFTFTAPLWRWTARQETGDPSAWCFVTLPLEVSEEVRVLRRRAARVRVGAGPRCGRAARSWDTSVFPDAEARAASCCR